MKKRFLSCGIALLAVLQVFAVNDFTINGIGYVKLGGDSVEVGENRDITGNLVIPESVTNLNKTYRVVALGDNAFQYCRSLTSVTIPNSVTSIGEYAFFNCSSLTSVTIGNSVTSISNSAFSQCYSLANITIGNSVTSIGNKAFYDCYSLTNVTIPNSVDDVGIDAFYGTNISTPLYNDHLFILLPPNYVGSYTIPDGITTINQYACDGHIGLTDIIFPKSLQKISSRAFRNCRNISSVVLPANINTIEFRAFEGCVDITDVYVNSKQPPVGGNDIFTSNPTVHLACGVDYVAYQNDYNWQKYNLEYPEPNYTLTLSSDESKGSILTIRTLSCDNDTAVIFAKPNEGYMFTGWSDGNADNPRTIIMQHDMTLYANFAVGIYDFSVKSMDNNIGSVTGNSGKYQYGTQLTISASPTTPHYQFDHWHIEQTTNEAIPESTITVTEAYNIAAALAPDERTQDTYLIMGYITGNYRTYYNSYYIADEPGGNTNFVVYSLDMSLNIGDKVIVMGQLYNYGGYQPETFSGSVFKVISQGSYVYNNPYTLTLKGNTTATAVFTTTQYNVCFSCNNGYISSKLGDTSYRCYSVDGGTLLTATVIPDDGYIFQQWSDGNTDNPRTFTIEQDVTLTAICIRDQCLLTLNSSDSEMGAAYGSGNYDRYTRLQIFAIPNPGYEFVDWSDGQKDNPRYLYLSEPEMSLTANFVLSSSAQYMIDVTSQNPALGSATAVEYVLIEAIPFDGCTFVSWSDGNTENPRYIELNADINLQAIFSGGHTSINAMPDTEKGTIRKIMVNGSLFIIKDDNIYNSLGTQLK